MLETDAYPKFDRAMEGFSVSITDGRKRTMPIIEERGENSVPRIPSVTPHYKDSPLLLGIKKDPNLRLIEAVGIPNLLLAIPSFAEVREKPLTHPGSDSKYLVEMVLGNDIFMVSTLAPNKLTSTQHFHLDGLPFDMRAEVLHNPDHESVLKKIYNLGEKDHLVLNSDVELDESLPGVEYYDVIYGLALLHHIEGDKGYPMPKYFSVEPGVNHRMEAGPNGAVFGILMKNAALYPPELRHIHTKSQ
ncbi:MAG TPA: hypothetical protein VG917_03260 [Patescibacteria group bacterium]|nr:hypothetical protein [Patescibacteria group bacterium]